MTRLRTLLIASSAFCLGTFAVLMVHPDLIYLFFSLDASPSADVMSRRAAILFLATGVILWRLRNIEGKENTAGLAFGMAVFAFGFAILGIAEFARGTVGAGILVAVAMETLLGILFIKHAKTG